MLLALFLFLGLAPAARAEAGQEMNGLSLHDVAGFEKNWHLVTVRYRKDNKEIRFVYANDAAWDTLEKKSPVFPDGATFVKVAAFSKDDPAFPSSAVPTDSRRYQIMRHDSKKFARTDGWGYALFDRSGKVYPEDPKLQERACAACHKLVADRGFVFSQIFDLRPSANAKAGTEPASPMLVEFEAVPASSARIPKAVRRYVGKFSLVYLVKGSLNRQLFQGTLDEIRPSLELKAAETNAPAALIAADGSRFSLVLPTDSKACAAGKERPLRSVMSGLAPKDPHRDSVICYEN